MKRPLVALIALLSLGAVNAGDPPILANPGAQTNAVTDRYGYAGTVLSAAPAGYWRLEHDGQATVTDWSNDPHAGTASGCVARGVAGPLADGSTRDDIRRPAWQSRHDSIRGQRVREKG